ncbi:TIP120 domain-containing protein [Anaeramoeba flamelloides]|uniref:TIP120 domain-containing protein n=1 Tax=Anaeramoeba flamelloides TaxID=1746091 RepID=A0ABQ8Z7D9_9EUKA|nr:TIP120 domain-containing protein [Anaeramoeba flamelloides]
MSISEMIKQMESIDYDVRFMVLHDLSEELVDPKYQIGRKADELINKILELISDSSGDVQSMAIDCIKLLVNKVNDTRVYKIFKFLTEKILYGKEEFRDVYTIALKGVFSQLENVKKSLVIKVGNKTIPNILEGIRSSQSSEIKSSCIGVIDSFLRRYGHLVPVLHEKIQHVLFVSLPTLTVTRTAIESLSFLPSLTNDPLFFKLLDSIIEVLENNSKILENRVYIQLMAAIAKNVGSRIDSKLKKITELLIGYIQNEKYKEKVDLIDSIFYCFESFILNCPFQIGKFIDTILTISLKLISYDPYYNMDSESGSDFTGSESMSDESESSLESEGRSASEEYEEDYSEDDEMSWKIRRGSIKCLLALIKTRPELVNVYYEKVSNTLISRFSEREDYVKLDIYETYIQLLQQTRIKLQGFSENEELKKEVLKVTKPVINSLHREFNNSSLKSRIKIFVLLTELVKASTKDSLLPFFDKLFKDFKTALFDKFYNNSQYSASAILFFRNYLIYNNLSSNLIVISSIFEKLNNYINSPENQLSIETLKICSQISETIRFLSNDQEKEKEKETEIIEKNKLNEIAINLFDMVNSVFKEQKKDTEVKETSIIVMSSLIYNIGDYLENRIEETLNILFDRMKIETTRVISIKSLKKILESGSKWKIGSIVIIENLMKELSKYLLKHNRVVRQYSLIALIEIIKNYNEFGNSEIFTRIISVLSNFITDQDPLIANLSLQLGQVLVLQNPYTHEKIVDTIVEKAFNILISPMHFQETNLVSSAIGLYKAIVQEIIIKKSTLKTPIDLTFSELIEPMVKWIQGKENIKKDDQGKIKALAQCVSELSLIASSDDFNTLLVSLLKNLKEKPSIPIVTFSLYSIARIGIKKDLSSYKKLKTIIYRCFAHISDDIKIAASYCLGNIAIGNLKYFLHYILKQFQIKSKHNFSHELMRTIKEIIDYFILNQNIDKDKDDYKDILNKRKHFESHLEHILNSLFQNCESEIEVTRNLISECLGKIAILKPKLLINKIIDKLSNVDDKDNEIKKIKLKKSKSTKSLKALKNSKIFLQSTLLNSLKFAISKDDIQKIDKLIQKKIKKFIIYLENPDYLIRLATLTFINTAARKKFWIIQKNIKYLLTHLLKETKINKELIGSVEMGQFNYKIDEGLENRKLAYDTLNLMILHCNELLKVSGFIDVVKNGIEDPYIEINLITLDLFIKLIQFRYDLIRVNINKLIDPLKKSLTKSNNDENEYKQNVSQNEELINSALKAIYLLNKSNISKKEPKFADFFEKVINRNVDLKKQYQLIVKNSSNQESKEF